MTLLQLHRSIERKLPLLVSALLVAVVVVLSGAAYVEVRRSARLVAIERLQRTARELGELFHRAAAQRVTELGTLASDSGIKAFAASGGRAARAPALRAMRGVARENLPNVAVEVWDPAGHLLLRAGDSTLPSAGAPPPAAPDSVTVGPLQVARDTVLLYAVRAGLVQDGRRLGQVVQLRRVTMSAQARQTITGLMGADVTLLYGNGSGDPWTDLATVIPAPPPEVRGSQAPVDYERGEAKFGLAFRIASTPWMMLVEFPRQRVFAAAQRHVARMAVIAAIVVLLGAAGAWLGSRRITLPLRRLTQAAAAITGGDLTARVEVPGSDELGQLALAFNSMADEVARSRRDLEAQVAERTSELEVATQRLEKTSEERYRVLFQSNPLPMWVYDMETFAFLDVNDAAVRRYGYSREEFLRMSLKDIRPPADIPRFLAQVADSPEGLVNAGLWRHKRKDGTVIDVEVTRHRLRLGGRVVGLSLAHDVTERLLAERALRDSEQALRRLSVELEQRVRERTAQLEMANQNLARLAAIVDSSDDAIVSYSLEARIQTWNPAAASLYGYAASEAIGQPLAVLLAPERAAEGPALLNRIAHGERVANFETERRRKDGTLFPMSVTVSPIRNAAGLVVGASSIGRDISARRQMEAALRASEERFRILAETANDAIVSADAQGVITYVNAATERDFGYEAADLKGRPLTVLMPDRFQEAHRAGLKRYIATGEAHVIGRTVELSACRRDGSEFPIELSLATWRAGTEVAFTAFIRDITERKRTEEALARHGEELARANAELGALNRELEAFSYSVSHDLRAPLRAIHGFARILTEDHGPRLDAEATRLLGVISENTKKMGQLIDDLLSFSRLGRQELQKTRVDMIELVAQVTEEVKREEDGAGIEVAIADLPPAHGDRALLRQVVSNLVQNAAKFSRHRPQPRVEIGYRHDNGENVYFVKDNGVGFDMRYAEKLFGVFQRLHRAEEFEGTGVGLATVQRVIHRHGGRVWAEAKVGEGATFYFTLPGDE